MATIAEHQHGPRCHTEAHIDAGREHCHACAPVLIDGYPLSWDLEDEDLDGEQAQADIDDGFLDFTAEDAGWQYLSRGFLQCPIHGPGDHVCPAVTA